MQPVDLGERRTFLEERRSSPVGPRRGDGGEEHALVQWMEADGRARLLVDDALRICWLSPGAEKLMIGPGAILVRRNGHLRTRENRFDRQMRELIDCASPQMSSCCVHDPKTGEHLVLTAVRLSPPSEDRVGLTLARASDDFPFHVADLHSAFGLTPREGQVSYHLLCGRTAEETAQELEVALDTVRTHIKRAYGKLGVSSRDAFLHRLTPFIILPA